MARPQYVLVALPDRALAAAVVFLARLDRVLSPEPLGLLPHSTAASPWLQAPPRRSSSSQLSPPEITKSPHCQLLPQDAWTVKNKTAKRGSTMPCRGACSWQYNAVSWCLFVLSVPSTCILPLSNFFLTNVRLGCIAPCCSFFFLAFAIVSCYHVI
jgi:hypothetical protein